MNWTLVNDKLPPEGIEVIGFKEEWIDEDYNTNGTRICFYNDGMWDSAIWDNELDTYKTDFTSDGPTHYRLMPQNPL